MDLEICDVCKSEQEAISDVYNNCIYICPDCEHILEVVKRYEKLSKRV
jgi:hypothetical protein